MKSHHSNNSQLQRVKNEVNAPYSNNTEWEFLSTPYFTFFLGGFTTIVRIINLISLPKEYSKNYTETISSQSKFVLEQTS
jgi:hypothetical protein